MERILTVNETPFTSNKRVLKGVVEWTDEEAKTRGFLVMTIHQPPAGTFKFSSSTKMQCFMIQQTEAGQNIP